MRNTFLIYHRWIWVARLLFFTVHGRLIDCFITANCNKLGFHHPKTNLIVTNEDGTVIVLKVTDSSSSSSSSNDENGNMIDDHETFMTNAEQKQQKALTTTHSLSSTIRHPVLQKMYPIMIQYKEEYGHPNIPLPEGKQLDTLRRLHIQNKLSESDVTVLGEIGFRFHSLEDVYTYADFDTMFTRLLEYRDEYGDVSPPKKYKFDPELGAWVTGIRRLGIEHVTVEHRHRLDSIHFQWTSPRQCGSTFMQQYRSLLEQVQQSDGSTSSLQIILQDESIRKWIRAIQNSKLSETRQHYMETLLGTDWNSQKFD